jgi:hypothetical protein
MPIDETATFFFALFWAAMTGAAARFKPFDSATAWDEHFKGTAARRLVLAFIFLDFIPLILFVLWLSFVRSHTWLSAVASAAAALSLFGVYRIFIGVVLKCNCAAEDDEVKAELVTVDRTDGSKLKAEIRFMPRKEGSGLANLYTGLIWTVGLLSVAALIAWRSGNSVVSDRLSTSTRTRVVCTGRWTKRPSQVQLSCQTSGSDLTYDVRLDLQ